MYYLDVNRNELTFNCGIMEIGHISHGWDCEWDADGIEIDPPSGIFKPTSKDWFELLNDEIGKDLKPIIVFSYNREQVKESKKEINIYSLLKFLLSQKQTVTLSPWRDNVGSEIQMATWCPTKSFLTAMSKALSK